MRIFANYMRIQIYDTMTILVIICLVWPSLIFGQGLPENLEDFKGIGERILDGIWQEIKGAWEGAVKIWKKVWGWIVNIFKSYIFPFFKFIWQKILNFFIKIGKWIWEKIKELIK